MKKTLATLALALTAGCSSPKIVEYDSLKSNYTLDPASRTEVYKAVQPELRPEPKQAPKDDSDLEETYPWIKEYRRLTKEIGDKDANPNPKKVPIAEGKPLLYLNENPIKHESDLSYEQLKEIKIRADEDSELEIQVMGMWQSKKHIIKAKKGESYVIPDSEALNHGGGVIIKQIKPLKNIFDENAPDWDFFEDEAGNSGIYSIEKVSGFYVLPAQKNDSP